MSKTCLRISFAVILTLFVVNLNANPKPKADNGIDIIINRVGPMVGPRILGLRKPDTGAGHWGPPNPGPEPKEVELPVEDYPGYRTGYLRSAVLPASKPAAKLSAKPAAKSTAKLGLPGLVISFKCCPPKLITHIKPVAKPDAKLGAKPKKIYRSAVLPAAKPAPKQKKLMKGARWIPRAPPPPEYEVFPNQWNDDYYPYDY